MQTPVEIDFQGMSGTPEVHASIEKHVAELEQRYGRVTACRVVLKGPGGHHRTGGLYEVNVVWPSRTVAKSMSGEPRRRTSARPVCHLPSMMPSSMCDAGCRIMFAACRDR